MTHQQSNKGSRRLIPGLIIACLLPAALSSCGNKAGAETAGMEAPVPELPVLTLDSTTAMTTSDYSALLEGKVNVDIRPQVDGYLDKIFVDEGSFVKAGQPLFQINDQTYREQLNKDIASLHAMESALNAAQLEVDKVKPLVDNKVMAEMQLKTALATLQTAKANVEQAKAAVASSRINVGFTLVKAPVSGYIGRIPKRIGNLVGKGDAAPLTTLSDISEVYAYFSMSENDFMNFSKGASGVTLQQQLKQLRPVTLILSNGETYSQKGRIEMVDGQFNRTTAAISLRATFPNPASLLRSGNTGKVRVEQLFSGVIQVPQAATLEMQDKVFVYQVADSNKVVRRILDLAGRSGENFIVRDGVKKGDKIVTAGIETLMEGAVVKPAAGTKATDAPAAGK
ncbi:efflux RND transporter periplasmic adaptor subunit [Chitinophaga oryzae]|uniref:Efflux RND transporter periplasmic adaptor subunit n=1 Tax=Chitinophaga oryzae TaxID=2725414 RepID=A0AAE7D625_9BACT|nr:efflux RND transporter periplasmic adaptor subunit [Chitinophaga oryzae]QJB30825.1 efflux RND transporter periplasmic adaptor subunit [Chitinophaga oryzae]QJB37316.1 efflux RND transporter periplasmic adaptor subunit [Chitinophaga oryzae]